MIAYQQRDIEVLRDALPALVERLVVIRMTPGSTASGLVPMQSPSSAVNPRLLSMLLPFLMAQRLAPLPRWATITRPSAISGATRGSTEAMYSYDNPWKP